MAGLRLAAYLLAAALMTALAGAVVEPPARGSDVVVLVEVDLEIPPLAYYDGREFRPVHVAYVGEWEEAYWVEANATVRIPTWSFKKAVIYLPREALRAKAPPHARGGVLRIYLNQTVVELVEAPTDVVATYSYLKPDEAKAPKARAEWIRPPTRKPLDKDLDRGGEDRRSSSYQTSTQSTPVVSPSGAFIYRQYTGWINADDEVCLNILMPDSPDYAPGWNPTVAAVGYNATYVWRTAWYVYTSSYGRGVVVGRGVVKAWAVDPGTLDKRSLLGQWAVDLRNGYVTYTTSIPLSWPSQFVGVELCFVPYYSASYVVGANATLGFRKNAIPAASGAYFLGIEPAYRSQIVGGVTHLLRPPIRNLVFGPFSLADGYYGETLNIDMTVYVPWSTPPCPTLTVTTYVGELANFYLDSASFTASSYNNGACIYEVQRSATLSSTGTVGLWYDEARARDKAVVIKVSFSLPASEVVIYRVDISGRRFAENYIDKNNVYRWRSLVLRGFFSQTTRYCGVGSLPLVNYTLVLVNIETYSWASKAADLLAVVTGAPSDFVIKEVLFRVRPARAFGGVNSVYVKGNTYEEPWWLTWAFRLAQSVKTALDFFERIPGPLSWAIDRVFDLRSLSNPDIRISTTTDYVEVYWRAGLFDMLRQVAFEIKVSQIDRTIEIDYARVATDYAHLCVGYVASPMPAVDLTTALPDLQYLRHWVFGMRVTEDVPFVK
jgi:hypothetical protein